MRLTLLPFPVRWWLRDRGVRVIDRLIRAMNVSPYWFHRDRDGHRCYPADIDDPNYHPSELPPVPERYLDEALIRCMGNKMLAEHDRVAFDWACSTNEPTAWWDAADLTNAEIVRRSDRGEW